MTLSAVRQCIEIARRTDPFLAAKALVQLGETRRSLGPFQKKILEFLLERGEATSRQIAEELLEGRIDCRSTTRLSSALVYMSNRGMVYRKRRDKGQRQGGHAWIWSVVETAPEIKRLDR